jgi:hypothetical protein
MSDMASTNGTEGGRRAVSSLGELARDIPPPRDLWPSIAAQIAEGKSSPPQHEGGRSRRRPTGLQWAALAAVVAALAVGMWIGRSVLPGSGAQPPVLAANGGTSSNNGTGVNGGPATPGAAPAEGQQVLAASFVTDPRYLKERQTMVAALEAQLNTLPLETQQKVASSLKTIRASMKDIQAALGRDPANALLQELLVNTYQDEMRVLTAVHEASGDAGRGI